MYFYGGTIRAGNLGKLLLHIEAGEEFDKIKRTLLTSISARSMAHKTISAHSFQNSYTRVACGLCFTKSTQSNAQTVFRSVCSGLLSLALFAGLESVCQGVQCHVSISLLAVVSHQSDPHHLMKREVESTAHKSLQWLSSMIQTAVKTPNWWRCPRYLKKKKKRIWFSPDVWFI